MASPTEALLQMASMSATTHLGPVLPKEGLTHWGFTTNGQPDGHNHICVLPSLKRASLTKPLLQMASLTATWPHLCPALPKEGLTHWSFATNGQPDDYNHIWVLPSLKRASLRLYYKGPACGHHHIPTFKLRALIYDILPPTPVILDYAIGLKKLSANGLFFIGERQVCNGRFKLCQPTLLTPAQRKPKSFEVRQNSSLFSPPEQTRLIFMCVLGQSAVSNASTVLFVPKPFGGCWQHRWTVVQR